jgi:Lrp/AsnC family leucine-responsive transcriptional regulator
MSRCPEVTQCSELAGDVDYLLTVQVGKMQEFADFTRTQLGDDRRIRSYRSLLVLRQLKNEHELPV